LIGKPQLARAQLYDRGGQFREFGVTDLAVKPDLVDGRAVRGRPFASRKYLPP
jgi:hypothetical protein